MVKPFLEFPYFFQLYFNFSRSFLRIFYFSACIFNMLQHYEEYAISSINHNIIPKLLTFATLVNASNIKSFGGKLKLCDVDQPVNDYMEHLTSKILNLRTGVLLN